jgi:hypothetical protein
LFQTTWKKNRFSAEEEALRICSRIRHMLQREKLTRPLLARMMWNVYTLQSLLAFISKPSGSESLAITGKNMYSRSFTVCDVIPKNAWILGSGATNHMTFDSTLLSSYTSPSSIPYIIIFRCCSCTPPLGLKSCSK